MLIYGSYFRCCHGLCLDSNSSAQNTAAPTKPSANEVVKAAFDKVTKIIINAQGYYDTDPKRFYNEIEQVLVEFVDFDENFARGVMGIYASKKYYMALESNQARAAFKARIKRFANTFQDGLVQTYAKGLLTNGNKIEVLPPAKGAATKGKCDGYPTYLW